MNRRAGKNKYSAVVVHLDGIRFASKAEAKRYGVLKLLQKAGRIEDLELQRRYPLVVNGVKLGHYVADFTYTQDGVSVVEDVKGVATPTFRLKQKLMRALYGIEIQVVPA